MTSSPAASSNVHTGKPTSYAAFRKHVRGSLKNGDPIFSKMDRAKNANLAQITRIVKQGSNWADEELKWLVAHAPRECYADFYEDWRGAIAILADGMTTVKNAIATEDTDEAMRGLAILDRVPDFREPGALSPIKCSR